MSDATAVATEFDALDRLRDGSGAGPMLDHLIRLAEADARPRVLLDALLLKARHDLGLPAVVDGPLSDLPEPGRSRYEERYVEAIRTVGSRLLAAGDLVAAWSYFRAIGEREPVAQALEAYRPEEADDRLGAIVDLAFSGGAHPRRGFELILQHYGTCSAITAFEQLQGDESVRARCAGLLVEELHRQLGINLAADLERRGVTPAPGTSLTELVAAHPELFEEDGYHLDVSHLASVVRMSPLLSDPAQIRKAVELTEYGRRLSERHRYEGEPPFERLYEDQGLYLRALLGEDVDAAVAHFREKLEHPNPEYGPGPATAQVLIRLLDRVGRSDEAIEVAAEHLEGLADPGPLCPSLAQLCRRHGRLDRLARAAMARGDLVQYAAARLGDGSDGDRG